MTLVLGIETTCDETAVALVADGQDVLAHALASSAKDHVRYGGVVPEIASRGHADAIHELIERVVRQANVGLQEIDLIAVARGPGLIGSLLLGVTCAQALAWALNKPLVGVNHVEAHLYVAGMAKSVPMPALGVVLSGGHTSLVCMDHLWGPYTLLAETVDDAIGEAFDKTAVLLGLPYPGGPHIEEIAQHGDPYAYPFKVGTVKGRPLHFSFSGLKTNVLYAVKGQNGGKNHPSNTSDKCDIAASFQRAAFDAVLQKTQQALKTTGAKCVLFGGGVTQNLALRKLMEQTLPVPVFFPEGFLSLDNAAMIAGLAFHLHKEGRGRCHEAAPSLSFS